MNQNEVNKEVSSSNGNHKEQVIKRTADIQVAEDFTFSKFLLSDKLLKSLNRLNFVKPSPVQLKVIPLAKCGLDMIMQAKSGTGKTLAFAICLLESYDQELKFPQSLVIVPTREIAVQIVGVLNELGRNLKHFKACEFIGGTEVANDRKKIQSAKVIVGTPGRILHLVNNEIFNISCLKSLVLDEADKLLESGQMAKDVMTILKMMHKKIQIIAATATVTSHLEKIMKHTMKNPIGITPKHEIPVLLGIKQFVKVLPRESDNILLMNAKINELQKIFTRITFKQCLLFTDSQTKTQSYGNYLSKRGWKNEVINGSQDQSQRLEVLEKLNTFKCRILITTDLMARGIDIENVNLIINLDLPYDCFTYLHRIGRAGRFGTHGIAITFVNGEEDLLKFQKMLGDIGGETLKALKFPDESTSYDFWKFEQEDENILETVAGFSKNDEDAKPLKCQVNLISNKAQDESNNLAEDTVMNNLALLEMARKLVDDKSKETKAFDLNAIIEDYEKSSEPIQTSNGHYDQPDEEENVFLKIINEMKLYAEEDKIESDPNLKKIPLEDQNSTKILPETVNQERHVIFKRTNVDVENELLSETSSESMNESETESSESDQEEEEQAEEETAKELLKARDESCVTASQYFNYHHYVTSQYSHWENIYFYQLANIQNYLQSSRK